MKERTCEVSGCDRPVWSRRMCTLHYNRNRRYGSTDKPRRRPDAAQSCMECGTTLQTDALSSARFCSALCRNRWNNRLTGSRPVAEHEHGLRTGYARGCRCLQCRACVAEYSRQRRARQPKKPPKPRIKGLKRGPRKPTEHGTSTSYAYGCRCQPCKTARSAQNAAWAKRNPEKFEANQRKYRRRNPRGRGASVYDSTASDYLELIASDPCVYCGGRAGTVDHIQPVAEGGHSDWTNLTPACRGCNASKGTRGLLQFLTYRLFISDREVISSLT